MNEIALIEEYRKKFKEAIEDVMPKVGNDLESTDFILDSALDLALTDKRNEVYK